jgi:hypothetical protein
MFILDRNNVDYEVKTVYRAIDNRDFTRDFAFTSEDEVTIRNPFPTQRVVDVTPRRSIGRRSPRPSSTSGTRIQRTMSSSRILSPSKTVTRANVSSLICGTSKRPMCSTS